MATISFCDVELWLELSLLLSIHFHNPYVLPTVVCQSLNVPSSEPLAYNSPSGLNCTVWIGPKWPLNDSKINEVYLDTQFYMTNERKKKTNLILGTEKTTFDLDLYILPIISATESKICYICYICYIM